MTHTKPNNARQRRGAAALMAVLLPAVLLLAVLLLGASTALAQGGGSPVEETKTSVLQHFLIRGGVITYIILVPLSFVTMALIFEHLVNIRRGALIPDALKVTVVDLLQERRYKDLLETTAADKSLLGGVLNAGLNQANNGLMAIERAMEEVLESRAAGLFRRIEYLNIIGNISPMIGLFGTVYGMIKLFSDIVEVGGQPDPAVLAGGISIALVTTFWGLLVAIPALSIFHILRNRIDGLLADCAVEAEELLVVFRPQERGKLVPTKQGSQRPDAQPQTAPTKAPKAAQ